MQGTVAVRTTREGGLAGQLPLLVIPFWLFTYALLSWRTVMVVGDAFQLISARRLIGTTAGALVYWVVMEWMQVRRHRANPLALLLAILPATLVVLVARLAFDQIYSDRPVSMDLHVRWVMAWAGYFGLWVSAFLAVAMHRDLGAALPGAAAGAAPEVSPWGAVVQTRPALPEAEAQAWEWAVDVLAQELAQHEAADRAELARRLVAAAGYEAAPGTEPDQAHNARILLAQRLAARLDQKGTT